MAILELACFQYLLGTNTTAPLVDNQTGDKGVKNFGC